MTRGNRSAARSALGRYWRDPSGATVIEYAGIAGAIALVLIAALPAIGQLVADGLTALIVGLQ